MNILSKTNSALIKALCFFPICYISICLSDDAVSSSLHPFNPNVLSNKSYSEVYKLTTLYDDGTFIQTQMIVTNIGLDDSNAACGILVLHAGEKPVKTGRRFKKSCWKYSDAPNPALSIGPCSLTQEGGSTRCVMVLNSALATICLDQPPKRSTSQDTILADPASKKFYTNEVIVPWTMLNATVRLPGLAEKQLHGFGMLEHSRSAGFPKDFSRGWICFYGFRGDSLFLAEFHFPPAGASGAVGWTLNSRDQTPKPLAGVQMVMKAKGNCGHEIALPFVNAPNGLFAISGEQSLFRFSIVDELGPVLGNIVRLIIGNPVTRFYRARVSTDRQPIEGVLEMMNFE